MSARGAGEWVRPSVWPISCASTTNRLRPRRRLRDQRSSWSKCASPRRGRKACARAPPAGGAEGQGAPPRAHRPPPMPLECAAVSSRFSPRKLKCGAVTTRQLWRMDARGQSGAHTAWGQTAGVPTLVLPFTSGVTLGRAPNPSVPDLPDLKTGVMTMKFFLTGFF